MSDFKALEVWLVTGSRHLGKKTLRELSQRSTEIAAALSDSKEIPAKVVPKPVFTTPDAIRDLCVEARSSPECIGIVAWMHASSPGSMWVGGWRALSKPMFHMHALYNSDMAWHPTGRDFLNQPGPGDRGSDCMARIEIDRKVAVGHWEDQHVQTRLGVWCRAAAGWHDSQRLRIAQFGRNMLDLVATDSDKLMSRARFGYSVTAIDIDLLAHAVSQVSNRDTDRLAAECAERYEMTASLHRGGRKHQALRDSVRTELGLRSILEDGGFRAFTYNSEDLYGLERLPGLAVQRLMEDGYGFGAEGDWRTAALVRTMKVMSSGLPRGATFLADDGYEFGGSDGVTVAPALELCPSIAAGRPIAGIQPSALGAKADMVRLVFTAPDGYGVVASILQTGNLSRIIVNEVDVVQGKPLPEPPAARVVLVPRPSREVAAAAWIYAGGAHNAGFSQALTTEHLEDFAGMAGIEFLCIDADTKLRSFRNEIRWNDLSRQVEAWRLSAAGGRGNWAPHPWDWQYNREPFGER